MCAHAHAKCFFCLFFLSFLLLLTHLSLQKPEDWNEEEDGAWEAPTAENPKCAEVSGCGPWTRPQAPNPLYKGKWVRPMIPNPAYKGPWSPRQVRLFSWKKKKQCTHACTHGRI